MFPMRRLLIVPVLLLLAACGGGGSHDAHGANSDVPDGARVVAVTGTSFAFDPPEISAEPGEAIAVELTAADAEHDFTIDELDAHIVADEGETATGGFEVGDEPGAYTYYCAVAGHREAGMEGRLVVG
jgi:plastocyanin